MSQKKYMFTPKGLAKLKAELEHLRKVRRQEVAEKMQLTREAGPITDSAEYEEAKNEQAFIEGRILTLENMIEYAVISTPDRHNPLVEFGDRITVLNQEGKKEVFTIVGSAEANAKQGNISIESPVGQALLGKRVGNEVEVIVSGGVLKLTITNIG